MQLIGLTGGIASGKSTVAAILRDLGFPVLDADSIYHSLIRPTAEGQPSELVQKIGSVFSDMILPSGELDRAQLGSVVFHNAEAREALNQLTHPAISAAFQSHIEQLEQAQHRIVFYDVPLLFEKNMEGMFAAVVLVYVSEQVQKERLSLRNHFSASEAQARIQAQLSMAEKKQRAHYVIDNTTTLAETKRQVEALCMHFRTVLE